MNQKKGGKQLCVPPFLVFNRFYEIASINHIVFCNGFKYL